MHYDFEQLAPQTGRLKRDLDELALIHDPNEPGWTRRVFSEEYRASRQWVARTMRDSGLDVHVDGAGNLLGVLPGRRRSLPPLVSGSHTDTVRGGGRFDGVVGVLGAIEVARRLREAGIELDHDLVIVDFLGEETNDYGLTCLGSRALAGELTAADLDRTDEEGGSMAGALTRHGLDPAQVLAPGRTLRKVHAYLELHVEQGPLLERRGVEVGVVTSIAGIERLVATFAGRQDHAGTTPMVDRQDALVAAAQAVLAVQRAGCGAPVHGVATTGQLSVQPGALNVVPGTVRMWAEMRSVDPAWLSGTKRRLAEEIATKAAEAGVTAGLEWLTDNPCVAVDDQVSSAVSRAADSLGVPWIPVPSGATHDAVHMAHLGPMGMIFIPSAAGRSHCPEEWTELSHIATGVHVLGATLARLDVMSPP